MKYIALFLGSLFIISCSNVHRESKHVLVYTKNGEGYVHDNIRNNVLAIQDLGKENGFSVEVSENPEIFNRDQLESYSCIVFANTNNDVFDTDEQKLAFMHYIQAGGGFVGIHSASGTERNWKWFIGLLGGTFEVHAVYQEFTTHVVDNTHPSTRHLPEVWTREDECYFLKEMNPDIHVLIRHDLNSIEDGRKDFFLEEFGEDFPGAWYHEYDGGRSWYTSYGHNKEDYKDPNMRAHILGGIIYAIGENKKLDYRKATAIQPEE